MQAIYDYQWLKVEYNRLNIQYSLPLDPTTPSFHQPNSGWERTRRETPGTVQEGGVERGGSLSMTTTRRRKRHERLLEGTERGLDFCPLSVHFFGIFFFFPSFKILFTFLKKKNFYFFWFWLVAEKRGRKDMEINILAFGFMLVLHDSDCYKDFTNVCHKGIQ